MPKPTKEQVRAWQHERVKSPKPPPDPKQIRRELGWDLVEYQRNGRFGRTR